MKKKILVELFAAVDCWFAGTKLNLQNWDESLFGLFDAALPDGVVSLRTPMWVSVVAAEAEERSLLRKDFSPKKKWIKKDVAQLPRWMC